MNIYNNGKIYKLVNSFGTTYVGSTTQTLAQRKAKHTGYYKAHLKGQTKRLAFSIKLFVEDPDNVDIVLLELVNCNSKMELHQRERHYVESLQCVNKYIPTRTLKEYYDDNIDKILANAKIHSARYRSEHGDKIKEHKTKPHQCECGCTIQHDNISQHKKSNKHNKLMDANKKPMNNI
jgi:hypothetical protein